VSAPSLALLPRGRHYPRTPAAPAAYCAGQLGAPDAHAAAARACLCRYARIQARPTAREQTLEERMFPYQRQGVAFGLRRGGRVLIGARAGRPAGCSAEPARSWERLLQQAEPSPTAACPAAGDEMGLGKTVQACALLRCYQSEWPVLIITPSSLRDTWADALAKWLHMSRVHVVHSKHDVAQVGDGRHGRVLCCMPAGQPAGQPGGQPAQPAPTALAFRSQGCSTMRQPGPTATTSNHHPPPPHHTTQPPPHPPTPPRRSRPRTTTRSSSPTTT
jgi:hypothetical protein